MTHSRPIRTSDTHPIRIDAVLPAEGWGKIGMSFCPGKGRQQLQKGAEFHCGSWLIAWPESSSRARAMRRQPSSSCSVLAAKERRKCVGTP